MARNQKLTAVIRGRTVAGFRSEGDHYVLTFTDDSRMTIRTAPGWSPGDAPIRGTVRSLRQKETALDLDMEDGSTLSIQLAEATSSVLLRDRDGTLEYAD